MVVALFSNIGTVRHCQCRSVDMQRSPIAYPSIASIAASCNGSISQAAGSASTLNYGVGAINEGAST